jgi:hypothetical protein
MAYIIYLDDVNLLGKNIRAMKEHRKSLPESNVESIRCMNIT